ncbi:MAG: PIN domain-containing protein [Ardenticatenaceae bacterium]|nr:PIN domain-containing protein [Ardenticatenaceae bacterium]HBY92697.1 hypothetical protein [Chloroflexota bacterium]
MIKPARLRAVFDTNVIIAAIKARNPASPTAELIRCWLAGEFDLLYSAALLEEYAEKLVARKADPGKTAEFLAELIRRSVPVVVPLSEVKAVILADPDDDHVIACAVVGGATHIVTYDPHFAALGDSYPGIVILDGLHFLYAVRGDIPPTQTT